MHEIANKLNDVIAIARMAGARIREIYHAGPDAAAVTHKGDGSPLTAADEAAQTVIAAGLARLTPELPMLSEEAAQAPYAERAAWRRYWLVDPLDGTREFVARNGQFTVNIALMEEGEPVLGVVQVPESGACFYAVRGAGAFRQWEGRTPELIHARSYGGGPATVIASRSHGGAASATFIASVQATGAAVETRSLGSSLKLCLIAEGVADVYPRLGPTSEWDIAAAHCIVVESGGRMMAADGQPLRYNKPDILNPWFLACGAGSYDWTRHVPRAG